MVTKYGFSNHAEKNVKIPILSEISLKIILLSMIDSICLMVWEIHGSKVVEFAVYCDAKGKTVNLAFPYLSNLQDCIDHGEQNFR